MLTMWKKNGLSPPASSGASGRCARAGSGEQEATTTRLSLNSRMSFWISSWPGIRAHVLVVAGERHVGQPGGVLGDRLAIHHGRDVVAAMADVERRCESHRFVQAWAFPSTCVSAEPAFGELAPGDGPLEPKLA